MEFQWQYAKPLFEKLDVPDYGSRDNWMRWYEEAWIHLTKAELTEVKTPLDNIVVRLRIFAVGWLVHDFIGAVQSDEWNSCPYWEEWIGFLDIEPVWALLTIDDQKIVNALVAESGLSSCDLIKEEEGEGICCDVQEINDAFFHRITMVAVYMQRAKVIRGLKKGYGGEPQIFVNMYATCYSMEDEIERRISDLDESLEQLESQLRDAASDEIKSKLQASMDAVRQEIEDGISPQDVLDDFLVSAGGDVDLGDANDEERVNGCQWCCGGFPIVVRGEPAFYMP